MTADTALRLGRFFGMEAQFWMNLQALYDLDVAERESRKRIEREVTPLKEAA
jgi:plasmid maintenance system antidote protein VapI